jgi:hypothetical protein
MKLSVSSPLLCATRNAGPVLQQAKARAFGAAPRRGPTRVAAVLRQETAEQAAERRKREGEELEERIVYINTEKEFDAEMAKVGWGGVGGGEEHSELRTPNCLCWHP